MKKFLSIIIMFIGICLILYPFVGKIWNKNKQLRDIQEYEEQMQDTDKERIQEIKVNYAKYNGIIGSIEIPSINIKLPIYSNTQEKFLLNGVGILEGTALPNSSNSYHSIIVGHTGITGKIFFDNINKLVNNDIFYVEILSEKYKYEVCDIKTILPEDTKSLETKDGEKLVTLITCTPKYINTHRLLVTGKYIQDTEIES